MCRDIVLICVLVLSPILCNSVMGNSIWMKFVIPFKRPSCCFQKTKAKRTHNFRNVYFNQWLFKLFRFVRIITIQANESAMRSSYLKSHVFVCQFYKLSSKERSKGLNWYCPPYFYRLVLQYEAYIKQCFVHIKTLKDFRYIHICWIRIYFSSKRNNHLRRIMLFSPP